VTNSNFVIALNELKMKSGFRLRGLARES